MEKLKITTERLFLRSPNINVCFRIIIEGIFTPEKISAALETVSERHPLLTCSIEIDNDHNAWFIPGVSRIEIEYYKTEEMPDWKNWYNKTDNTPFDLVHGPLVKICVIMGNNQTDIIILGHHIIGDGIGYLNMTKDILLALDNRLETIPQIPPVNNTFIKGRNLKLLSSLYARKLNKEWRENPVHFSEDDYLAFFQDYRGRFVSQIYMDAIHENDLKELMKMCKAKNITVNELITSAFAAAFAADRELRIGVAASTRNELEAKPYYCMGNYVTGISIKVNCVAENDFMSTMKTIVAMLRKKLTNMYSKHLIVNFLSAFDNDLIESIMYASYGKYQLPISKKIGELIAEGLNGKGLGMSNLGRHEINTYNTFRLLDLQFIGPAFPANLLSVSIITVNNKLNICIRYNEAEIKTDMVINIYKKAMNVLFNQNKGNVA
jgi:NRPS condensation-like uncharacterized protein